MENEVSSRIKTFLTFSLDKEIFAVSVSQVINILEMTAITKIPQAPPYMLGVINLRGSVLPLVDLRIKLGMPKQEISSNTCILVLELKSQRELVKIGVMVDSVQEVVEIKEFDTQLSVSDRGKYNSEFIEGIANIDDNFIILLDMDILFSLDELIEISDKSEKD